MKGGMVTQIMTQNERSETKRVFSVQWEREKNLRPTKQRMSSLYKQKSLLSVLADDLVTC